MIPPLAYYTQALNWLEAHQLPCIFKTIFHFDCPGCGFQRSFLALLRADPVGSHAHYPALLPMLAFFLFLYLNARFHFTKTKLIPVVGTVIIFIIILTAYSIKLLNQN